MKQDFVHLFSAHNAKQQQTCSDMVGKDNSRNRSIVLTFLLSTPLAIVDGVLTFQTFWLEQVPVTNNWEVVLLNHQIDVC